MDDPQPNVKAAPANFNVWMGAGKRLDHVVPGANAVVVFAHKDGEDTWKLTCAPQTLPSDKVRMLSLYRSLQAHCQAQGWLQTAESPQKKTQIKTESVTIPIEALPELNAAIASQSAEAMEELKRKYPHQNGPADHSQEPAKPR